MSVQGTHRLRTFLILILGILALSHDSFANLTLRELREMAFKFRPTSLAEVLERMTLDKNLIDLPICPQRISFDTITLDSVFDHNNSSSISFLAPLLPIEEWQVLAPAKAEGYASSSSEEEEEANPFEVNAKSEVDEKFTENAYRIIQSHLAASVENLVHSNKRDILIQAELLFLQSQGFTNDLLESELQRTRERIQEEEKALIKVTGVQDLDALRQIEVDHDNTDTPRSQLELSETLSRAITQSLEIRQIDLAKAMAKQESKMKVIFLRSIDRNMRIFSSPMRLVLDNWKEFSKASQDVIRQNVFNLVTLYNDQVRIHEFTLEESKIERERLLKMPNLSAESMATKMEAMTLLDSYIATMIRSHDSLTRIKIIRTDLSRICGELVEPQLNP